MSKGFEQLKQNVIDRGLCTACGTCVGVCPKEVLEVTEVEGEPEPRLIGKCVKCGLCSSVCGGAFIPMADMDEWLFGKKSSFKNDPLGIYRKSLRGYSNDPKLRATSSSGGATTAIINYALSHHVIDGAIIASSDEGKPWRCAPALATTPEEMKRATRFTPEMVSVNALLRDAVVKKGYQKIAVVGLPCHIHSL